MNHKKDQRLEADPLFLVEYMKATITSDIYTVMEEESISKTELAQRLGKSRQYVSRILNETANFTLDSVARIAAALRKDIVLRLVDYDDEVVIRPFVKQEEYWFHTTQDFKAPETRERTDSLAAVPYKESDSGYAYVSEGSTPCTAIAGA